MASVPQCARNAGPKTPDGHMALGINPTYFRGHPRGLGRSWRRTMGSWRRNRPSGIRLREAPDADAPELRGTERSARPRVAARSLMSGASWPATVADASSTSVHVPGRVVVADFAVWTWRAPSSGRHRGHGSCRSIRFARLAGERITRASTPAAHRHLFSPYARALRRIRR
jgi:hypothetical protein